MNIVRGNFQTGEIGKKEELITEFTFENTDDLYTLILIANDNSYINSLGNPRVIDWNLDLLKEVIRVIVGNLADDMQENNVISLIASYIFNILCYALVNGKEHIGEKEMIKTFRDWNYLEHALKMQILTKICEELDFNSKEYDFFPKRKRNAKNKVVKFKKR